ncbi:MAG: hypothetical protein S4CHLAM81_13420 [Chlamydiales bacterium]|nr:hypothetical protein [Chlamydiales bacterium]MCH9636114.1 hypothetical protein [Chlamydiales bacterium]MCH9704173.1 hypothetical protein [Chlamydiota bacterium]
MSANIPPQRHVNLSPSQQKELGQKLDELGVHIDPKELKTMSMDQLQKKLIQAGKPEAFEKVKIVMKSFSQEGAVQSTPAMLKSMPPKLVEKLEKAFIQQFGKDEGPAKFQEFVKSLQQSHPDGNVPTGPALAKEMEAFLVKHHVQPVDAKAMVSEVMIHGESEGGLGSISSGGAETE